MDSFKKILGLGNNNNRQVDKQQRATEEGIKKEIKEEIKEAQKEEYLRRMAGNYLSNVAKTIRYVPMPSAIIRCNEGVNDPDYAKLKQSRGVRYPDITKLDKYSFDGNYRLLLEYQKPGELDEEGNVLTRVEVFDENLPKGYENSIRVICAYEVLASECERIANE